MMRLGWTTVLAMSMLLLAVSAEDQWTVAEGNESMMVAIGCFWCVEQAFEQYGPGVVEVISGYAGGELENPTYYNHDGHYEVVLIEYDPKKTSYEVLVNYAYRNMDPFDSRGQFCDKGFSYLPAIFYATDEELEIAERVLEEIVESKGWDMEDISAPILPRPKFWIAEDYHQDYYLKNPERYGYYKNACGRPKRLKDIWGLEKYECYHEKTNECFPTVMNADGEVVAVETNIKGAGAEVAAVLPPWGPYVIAVVAGIVCIVVAFLVRKKCYSNGETEKGK